MPKSPLLILIKLSWGQFQPSYSFGRHYNHELDQINHRDTGQHKATLFTDRCLLNVLGKVSKNSCLSFITFECIKHPHIAPGMHAVTPPRVYE